MKKRRLILCLAMTLGLLAGVVGCAALQSAGDEFFGGPTTQPSDASTDIREAITELKQEQAALPEDDPRRDTLQKEISLLVKAQNVADRIPEDSSGWGEVAAAVAGIWIPGSTILYALARKRWQKYRRGLEQTVAAIDEVRSEKTDDLPDPLATALAESQDQDVKELIDKIQLEQVPKPSDVTAASS